VWGSAKVNLIDLDNIPMESFAVGHPNAVTGKAMVEFTKLGVKLYAGGQIAGVVGGPHSKKAANDAGIFFDGYPGFIGRLTGSRFPFIMTRRISLLRSWHSRRAVPSQSVCQ
jgi:4-phospho-D-threonate 3-dehydrogenase / 4-phospho-D-erythronate 3-dehydrogenase